MLQPTESPQSSAARIPTLQQQPQTHSHQQPGTDTVNLGLGAGRHEKPTLWKWISVKELVFVFLACCVGAALFQTKDAVVFEMSWREKLDKYLYRNSKFPMSDEKLPTPLITDMDSDGATDLLMLTYDGMLRLYSFSNEKTPLHVKPSPKEKLVEKATANIVKLSEGSMPVAMATGYLRAYQSMIQVREQVVAVLTSDWTVLLLDHELKLLWKKRVTEDKDVDFTISEATVTVTSVSLWKGDTGSVIVGGREFDSQRPDESLKRMRRGERPPNEEELVNSLGHYYMYAMEGHSGELRWHHSPSDFRVNAAYSLASSSFYHIKLLLSRDMTHDGEVSWHQYSTAMRGILPHTWQHNTDTYFELAHFKKDKRRSKDVTEHISRVGDLAVDHITGLAFGGMQPHSASEHVEDPNVLILHSVKGLDVLHLYQGRPLCSLRLSPYHSTHADINGDGTIDHVHAVVNPGEAGFSDEANNEPDCYGQAVPMAVASRPLFKHSICKATHWTETFIATDKWLPALNKVGRKSVDHDITEPLPPVLIESTFHSRPLKLHLSGASGGWGVIDLFIGTPKPPQSLTLNALGPMYDSIFVLSSGRITSIGPHGEFNWQVDTNSDWDSASEVVYNPQHPSWKQQPEHISFIHDSFNPSAIPFSMKTFGKKEYVLVVGWQALTLISAHDGDTVSLLKFQCNPVAPLVVADFNNDGLNDIIVTCPENYIGFSLQRHSGFWQSTVLSLFVGMVIVVIAIYTRQKNVGLLPAVKTSQD